MNRLRFVGLDVHAETIAVAVAEPDGEVRSLGIIPNRAESVRRLVRNLRPAEQLRACYEAGPTGYVLYWQLTALGVPCDVVAPTLVPVKSADRVKTDRRDAAKLARCHRAGDLTQVWVPTPPTRRCGTWCELAKQPRKINCEHGIGWESFCCGTTGGVPRA